MTKMILMIIILAIVSTASGNTVTSVGLSLSTGFSSSDSNYTANLGQNFNVTANIAYNVNAQVTVLLNTTLPYSEQISETCLRTWVNGTKESCTNVSHLSPQLTFQPTTVSVLKNNVPLPATLYNIMTSGNGISFEFSHMSSVAESGTIAVHFQMFSTRNVRLIGEDLKFSVSGNLRGISLSTPPESAALLKIKGPRPSLQASIDNVNLEAGSTFKLEIKYSLENKSTEGITIFELHTITNPRDVTIVGPVPVLSSQINSSTIVFNDSTELTDASPPRIINYNYRVPDTFSLETPFHFTFIIKYRGNDTRDIDYRYTDQLSVPSSTTLSNKTTIGSIPPTLDPDKTFEIAFFMGIPKGTLYDFTLNSIFSSTTVWNLTMRILTRNVTTTQPLSTWSPASGINVDLSSMTVDIQGSGRRRRRATGGIVIVTSPPISLTNPSTSGPAFVTIRGKIGLNKNDGVSDPGNVVAEAKVGYGGNTYTFALGNIQILRAKLVLTKTYTFLRYKADGIPIFTVLITVHHISTSNRAAVQPILLDDVTGLHVTNAGASDQTSTSSVPTLFNNDNELKYLPADIPVGSNMTMDYTAEVNDASKFTANAVNSRIVKIDYYSGIRTFESIMYTDTASACLYKNVTGVYRSQANAGYVVLILILGILVGIGLVFLIWLIYWLCMRRRVNPYTHGDILLKHADDKKLLRDNEDILLLTGNLTSVKDMSNAKSSDSIVKTLVQEDHLQMYRDLDALDILGAATIDLDLEYEYEKMSVDANILLVNSVTTSSSLEKAKKDEILAKFHEDVKRINEENNKACTDALGQLSVDIRRKNALQFATLLKVHRKAKEELSENIGDNEELKKELMDLLEKQQQTERKDLIQKLKFEQDEQAEKTRKEFNLSKRSALRDRERELINEIGEKGKLGSVSVEWLMKEHARIQSRLDTLHDEEVAKQRGRLDQRLERRRALAKTKELEEENMADVMNTMQSQQITAIREFRRKGYISPEQLEEYMNQVKEDMAKVNENFLKLKLQEERALLDRLGQLKKKRMEEKMAEQEQKLQVVETRFQEAATGTDGEFVDPTSYLDERVAFRSQQRGVLVKLEEEIDEADTEELIKVYSDTTLTTKNDILTSKDRLFEQIKKDVVSESKVNKVMQQHLEEINTLIKQMETDRGIHKRRLEERIAERRKVIDQDSAMERMEQEELRRYENRVVDHLIEAQVAISDEERDRILLEHEKNMVQLENSLTLTRLRQKRMLEEAYVERKQKQMAKLMKKQTTETKNQERQQTMIDSDEEEFAEVYQKQREGLLQRQAQERLNLISRQDLEEQEELDIVRVKLIQERAEALKAQEEKLAAMVSGLQIAKAKEMCRIEEQQKAIGKLKMSLMDTISGRGILTEEKCGQVIQQHQEDVAKLTKKLDMQREKQEQLMRQKMGERIQEKELRLKKDGERQLESELSLVSPADKARIQIHKMIISQRQLVEREQMKQRMDHECNQVLQEAQRQFEVTRQVFLQRQELQFIAGLVRLGKFPREELLGVLLVLLPLYTRADLEAMLEKIIVKQKDEEEGPTTKPPPDYVPVFQNSKLIETAKLTSMAFLGTAISRFKSLSAKNKHRKEMFEEPSTFAETSNLPPVYRPDPIGGRDSPPGYGDFPMAEVKKKKKKKKLRKLVEQKPVYDEDDFAFDV